MYVCMYIVGHPVEFYRNQLGQFGVSGELAMRPVASLSGGQKSRVAFSILSMTKFVSSRLSIYLLNMSLY